jgi:hypothetical protein
MADSRLSVRDRELFLAEPHIAALSVSAGPDRGPLTMPIWYQYEPGGEAWVLIKAASRKARLIEATGRFTLMVERVTPTTRYVSVARGLPIAHGDSIALTRTFVLGGAR